jgi:hypothetical protein
LGERELAALWEESRQIRRVAVAGRPAAAVGSQFHGAVVVAALVGDRVNDVGDAAVAVAVASETGLENAVDSSRPIFRSVRLELPSVGAGKNEAGKNEAAASGPRAKAGGRRPIPLDTLWNRPTGLTRWMIRAASGAVWRLVRPVDLLEPTVSVATCWHGFSGSPRVVGGRVCGVVRVADDRRFVWSGSGLRGWMGRTGW